MPLGLICKEDVMKFEKIAAPFDMYHSYRSGIHFLISKIGNGEYTTSANKDGHSLMLGDYKNKKNAETVCKSLLKLEISGERPFENAVKSIKAVTKNVSGK